MYKILVPIDGSDYSRRALKEAIKIGGLFDTNLLILHVRPEHVTKVDDGSVDPRLYGDDETEKRSIALLDSMVDELSDIGKAKVEKISKVGNVAKLSKVGDVAETITSFIKKEEVDLVVMGSQGVNAGKIRSVFVGSVTKEVLAHSTCPVLVVK